MKTVPFLAMLLPMALIGCGGNGSNQTNNLDMKNQPPTIALETATKKLTDDIGSKVVVANNGLGIDVLKSIAKAKPGDSVFISPASLAMCLHMIFNGSAGDTEKAMQKALRLNDVSMDQLNDSNISLRSVMLSADPKVELSVANSMWLRQGFDVRQEFIDKNKAAYGMNLNNLNFTDPKSVDIINQWCSENTNGRIPKIIDQIKPDDILFLINAVYFKGKWSIPFKPENSKESEFTNGSGKSEKAMMMSLFDEFAYKQGENYQAIQLPYGSGRLAMTLVLPNADFSVNKMLEGLDYEKWLAYTSGMRLRDGTVMIPRIKFTGDYPLVETLRALGFGDMVDPKKADFTRIRTQKDVYVTEVKQKTFLEINEEGTEAAAVTEGAVGVTSAPMPQEPFVFNANRPFILTIEDSQTKSILFAGVIRKP